MCSTPFRSHLNDTILNLHKINAKRKAQWLSFVSRPTSRCARHPFELSLNLILRFSLVYIFKTKSWTREQWSLKQANIHISHLNQIITFGRQRVVGSLLNTLFHFARNTRNGSERIFWKRDLSAPRQTTNWLIIDLHLYIIFFSLLRQEWTRRHQMRATRFSNRRRKENKRNVDSFISSVGWAVSVSCEDGVVFSSSKCVRVLGGHFPVYSREAKRGKVLWYYFLWSKVDTLCISFLRKPTPIPVRVSISISYLPFLTWNSSTHYTQQTTAKLLLFIFHWRKLSE